MNNNLIQLKPSPHTKFQDKTVCGNQQKRTKMSFGVLLDENSKKLLKKLVKVDMRRIANSIFYKQSRFLYNKYNLGTCQPIFDVGKVSEDRFTVPDHIDKPPYYVTQQRPPDEKEIEIKNAEQIQRMRESCKLAANILKKCGQEIKVRQIQNYHLLHIHLS